MHGHIALAMCDLSKLKILLRYKSTSSPHHVYKMTKITVLLLVVVPVGLFDNDSFLVFALATKNASELSHAVFHI